MSSQQQQQRGQRQEEPKFTGLVLDEIKSTDFQLTSRSVARYLTPAQQLPDRVDMRPFLSPVRTQEQNSCVAYSLSSAIEYHARRIQNVTYRLSPQFIYDKRSNYPRSGMSIGAGMDIAKNIGVCPEDLCPAVTMAWYEITPDDSKTCCKTRRCNPELMAAQAAHFRIASYYSITTSDGQTSVDALRQALWDIGPVVIGAMTYERFTSTEIWKPNFLNIELGNHAMLMVGYDNARQRFTIRNSWGQGWGDDGYCYMPYADIKYILRSYVPVPVVGSSVMPDPKAPAAPRGCMLGEWRTLTCDASCGGGVKTSYRQVLAPPINGGTPCPPPAELTRREACNTQPCAVDCQVSEWGPWRACWYINGVSKRARSRTILVAPANGGLPCPSLEEIEPCRQRIGVATSTLLSNSSSSSSSSDEVLDCSVGQWSRWSACTDGRRTRSRPVLQQAANGGAACPDLHQSEACISDKPSSSSSSGAAAANSNRGGVMDKAANVIVIIISIILVIVLIRVTIMLVRWFQDNASIVRIDSSSSSDLPGAGWWTPPRT